MNIENKITNEYIGIKTLKDWDTVFNNSILGYSIYSGQCLNPFSAYYKTYPQNRGVCVYLYYLITSYFNKKSYYFNVFKGSQNWAKNRCWLGTLILIKKGRIFQIRRNDILSDKTNIILYVREHKLQKLKLIELSQTKTLDSFRSKVVQNFDIELPLL